MLLKSLLCTAAHASLTNDHGQFHKHKPNTQEKGKPTGPITVHVVPHSHDDVGWLKTVDAYFDGSNKGAQFTNVEVELTTVIRSLLEDQRRTFSEVEMKFFKMWWDK